jgi:hypothetical protein
MGFIKESNMVNKVIIIYICGFVACYFSGLLVELLRKKALGMTTLVKPDGIDEEDWTTLVSHEGDSEAENWLGFLERILAFMMFSSSRHVLIVGWLVFKVGCKWQVWSNIIQVPKELSGINDFSYLRARRRWGSHILMGFLISTLANILLGFGIAILTRLAFEL